VFRLLQRGAFDTVDNKGVSALTAAVWNDSRDACSVLATVSYRHVTGLVGSMRTEISRFSLEDLCKHNIREREGEELQSLARQKVPPSNTAIMTQNKIADLPSNKSHNKVVVAVSESFDPLLSNSSFSGTASLRRSTSRRQSISSLSKFFRRESSNNLVNQPVQPGTPVSVSPQPINVGAVHALTPTGTGASPNSGELLQPETPGRGSLVHSKSMIFFHSSASATSPSETVWEQAKKIHSTVPKPMFHWMRKQVIITDKTRPKWAENSKQVQQRAQKSVFDEIKRYSMIQPQPNASSNPPTMLSLNSKTGVEGGSENDFKERRKRRRGSLMLTSIESDRGSFCSSHLALSPKSSASTPSVPNGNTTPPSPAPVQQHQPAQQGMPSLTPSCIASLTPPSLPMPIGECMTKSVSFNDAPMTPSLAKTTLTSTIRWARTSTQKIKRSLNAFQTQATSSVEDSAALERNVGIAEKLYQEVESQRQFVHANIPSVSKPTSSDAAEQCKYITECVDALKAVIQACLLEINASANLEAAQVYTRCIETLCTNIRAALPESS